MDRSQALKRTVPQFTLFDFVRESNRIEGVVREPTDVEVRAHETLLRCDASSVEDLERFVFAIQPNAVLRRDPGMDVRVGNHVAPPGGPEIEKRLDNLLLFAGRHGAYKTHLAYETLHPFMDANGRSGRALWLWQMGGLENAPLGFLHTFYYQTLAESRP